MHQDAEQLRGLENEEPLTSSAPLIEIVADREHCAEPARTTDPDLHLETVRLEKAAMNHSDEHKEIVRNKSGSNCLINYGNTQTVFSEQGERFWQNSHTLGHTEKKLLSCSICSRRFKRKLDLVHHMMHHTQQLCDPNLTGPYQLENHTCVGESSQLHRTLTEPQLSSSDGLMRTGASEGLYKNLCLDGHLGPVLVNSMASPGSTFETDVHDTGPDHSKRPLIFPESDATFDPRTRLRCPTGEKSLSCLVSHKSFSWRRQLKRHTRLHTETQASAEPVKDTFFCPECGRRFVCKSYLKGHMRIHSGEARNSCSVCGKCFVLRSHLKEHMRSHTGERPFTCQLCNKRFKYSGNLGKHMKIHQRQTTDFPTEH